MKRLLIAFAAAATTFVASAWNNYADWFTESTDTVNWTGDYEFVEDAYVIDADFDNPATMTPKAEAPDTNTFTRVAINAKITPAALSTYDDLDSDVQTALIAAFDNSVTNYYAWLGGDWVALSGATPGDGTAAVGVTITFDYTLATPKANFKVGETTLSTNGVEWIELTGVNKRAVSTVAFAGSGTVNSVDADVGIAVAEVDGVKYGSYADAIGVATNNVGELVETVQILRSSTVETIGSGSLVSYSVDETGVLVDVRGYDYSPWSYLSGAVAWRGEGGNFEASKVADINLPTREIGEPYTMVWDQADTERTSSRFCSGRESYKKPGMLLVYDMANCQAAANATFSPLSFGGLWVKSLASAGTPYSVFDNSTYDRYTDFGAEGTNSYFKFEKSFDVDRRNQTRFLGDATVDIADGAIFAAQKRSTVGVVVTSGSTLRLTGATTGAIAVGAGLTVAGALDISAATVPTITGNVSLSAGSTVVLPAGTPIETAINLSVCSGTLSASGIVNVKIGDAESFEALLTVSGGAITRIDVGGTYTATISGDTTISEIQWQKGGESASLPANLALAALVINGSGTVTGLSSKPASVTLASGVALDVTAIASSFGGLTKSTTGMYLFTADYPVNVPQNYTYVYVGGETAGTAITISDSLTVNGALKTRGFINISKYYPNMTSTRLDVESGTTRLNCADTQHIIGFLIVRGGAILVNELTDAIMYSSYATTVDVYGTLDMGNTRWTLWDKATINVHGGTIIGAGEGSNGALDFMGTAQLNADETSEISASIKFRNALTPVTVNANKTLTLSGVIRKEYSGGGIAKKGAGTLSFTTDPDLPAGIVHENGYLTFNTGADVVQAKVVYTTNTVWSTTYTTYAETNSWKGTVVFNEIVAGNTSTQVHLEKFANANATNSTLVLNTISGNAWCAGSNFTVQPAITLSGDVNFQNGSSGSTVTFRKIASGTGDLTLKAWSGCTGVTYNFSEIDADNYSGTITLDGTDENKTITSNIGNIIKAGASAGEKVLALVATNSATVVLSGATLNGAATNLELRADGIYLQSSAPVAPEIKPGESGSSDCGTAEKAAAAAEAINNDPAEYIKAPTDAGLSGETAKDYADCFSARAEGTSVIVELNAAGTNALEVASTNTAAQVAASLSTIAATSTATEVAVTGAQPGFYYSVVYDDDLSTLDTAGTEGTRALAGANGSVTLAIPAKEQSATAGFYRVKVSVKPSGD